MLLDFKSDNSSNMSIAKTIEACVFWSRNYSWTEQGSLCLFLYLTPSPIAI